MYVVKTKTKRDREEQRKRNKTAEQPSIIYRTKTTGQPRIKILHATKGWRDKAILLVKQNKKPRVVESAAQA